MSRHSLAEKFVISLGCTHLPLKAINEVNIGARPKPYEMTAQNIPILYDHIMKVMVHNNTVRFFSSVAKLLLTNVEFFAQIEKRTSRLQQESNFVSQES